MTETEWLACNEPMPVLDAIPARKRLLFGLACCRRVAPLLTDGRVANSLALIESFVDGTTDLATLTSIQADLCGAVDDAATERYYAEADANFCSHPAFSTAQAMERAAYAVGGLFDQAVGRSFAQERGASSRNNQPPHVQSAFAAYRYAESFILWAYKSRPANKQRSPSYKVASVLGNQVRLSEAEVQAAILRDVFGNPFRPVVFNPEWRTSTVVALAQGIYDERAFDRLPLLMDALMDEGCGDEDVLSHCRHSGPHVKGCWVLDLVLGKE